MLEQLKEEVFQANLELPERGLIKYTWGNVSAVDREKGLFVIKPSGVGYDDMKASDMVVCDFDGNIIEGELNPSSDMPTHAVLYKEFPEIGAVVHTHSTWATIWAQAGLDVPAMGTTHADTFYGTVPCARFLTQAEIDRGYEEETGNAIVETFRERGIKPMEVPGVLLHGHGPFTWAKDAKGAVLNAVVLDEVCKTNLFARQLNAFAEELPQRILDKHYLRKHGENAYYGQKNKGAENMLEVGKKEFWFVVGSQHLYGEEALQTVKNNAAVIVESLNNSGKLPYPLVLQELAVTPDTITKIMKEVNYRDEVAGVITWMHTFSPAKMWIRGTKLLQKPLLHLATQFNESIPWATIDMDFMNLNQAAHGDREYGFINARLKKNNKVVVGYWERENVQTQIAEWMDVAVAYDESFSIKVARFGDNMRNVAVTEGDKVEAQIQFGWTVDYYGIRDLVDYVDAVADAEVDALFNEYKELYDFDYGDYEQGKWEAHVKVQARQEIGIRRFLEAGGYTAFTSNFEDLHGLQQLPGLAVQRLMAEGYGFAGEGDWKTAAIDRLMKIMSHNIDTGFMEDYTYEMAEGREAILQSHMLEVDPGLAVNKPKILIAPLSMGNREEPARLVFDGKAGDGVVVSMADFGTHYKLLVNEVAAFEPTEAAPNLPVARVLWEVKPNFHDGIRAWIEAGGGHHTVVSLSLSTDQILAWAKLVGLEVALIK